MNAQNRDQMTAMMDMYTASPSVREEVGTGANIALKTSASSQKKAKSLSDKYDRQSPSFKASVNASSGSKSLNV